MTIDRFTWTIHAEERLHQRGLTRVRVERAVRKLHPIREINDGNADWRVDAGNFTVVYDHPDGEDVHFRTNHQRLEQSPSTQATFLGGLLLVTTMYAYYDRGADIAWLPTGKAERVVSEEVEWGLIDHDATTDEIVAVEIWAASRRLPQAVLDALPRPGKHPGIAA